MPGLIIIEAWDSPDATWKFSKDPTCQHTGVLRRVRLGDTFTERLYGKQCTDCKGLLYS